MDPMTLTYDDVLVRIDDTVIEVFHRLVMGSQRTPLAWAAVQLKPKRGDQLNVAIGQSNDPNGPFYTDQVVSTGAFTFDVAASDEAKLRAFFDEAARRGGRSLQ